MVINNWRVFLKEKQLSLFNKIENSDYEPNAKPFLKWAGGKRQLLPELLKHIPDEYNTYIEPFVGGGALFFAVQPKIAILSDANEELINSYIVVRDQVERLIDELRNYINDEDEYYKIRAKDPKELDEVQRAARMIYLNKTCFNGLYRVNKSGEFNVPFGYRKNPTICDKETLLAASKVLQDARIKHGDYLYILNKYANPGDFIFLDPPYYPSDGYADFKRYTKEFFYEDDHLQLRNEFRRLIKLGSYVLLTNRNADYIRKIYSGFEYKAIDTKRSISSNSSTRTGEDLIVIATNPDRILDFKENLMEDFPGTRFMGSKSDILPFIWNCIKDLNFNSVLDAFSGSGCVSYMFKKQGKKVISNDYLHFAYHISRATIENSSVQLSDDDVDMLMEPNPNSGDFIYETFKSLYFTDEENIFLDNLRSNIELLDAEYKKSLAFAAISRACLKRRPRGIFTYVGDRYDDGRRDLQINLQQHFIENVREFNKAVFDNGQKNISHNLNVFDLDDINPDLVYLDPPYYTPNSDNDYIRRYHFIEGLVRKWKGIEIQHETKTKKFQRYITPFAYKKTVRDAFDNLFDMFKNSIIVVSYSSNSIPNKSEITQMLKKYKSRVRVFQADHLYSFGTHGHKVNDNANRVKEYIFVATNV